MNSESLICAYESVDDLARAFGAGCDARLAGKNEYSNPYQLDGPHYIMFLRGHHDVDIHWSVDAKWPTKKLPELKY